MRSFLRKLHWLWDRRRKETELEEEIRFHLEEEAEDREARGAATDEARSAARRELGNVALLQEETRAAWSWNLVEQFLQDLRYACRVMAANRTFAAMAVMSLALGIGANTAIFSLLYSILVRPLPVPHPESLVVFAWHMTAEHPKGTVLQRGSGSTYDLKPGITGSILPYPAYEVFRRETGVFSSVFGRYRNREFQFVVRSHADMALGEWVTGDYFRGLEIAPAAGRLILPDDDRPGGQLVVVISAGLSARRFGSPEAAVGQQVLINNAPSTVVGVTPPGFFGVDAGRASDFYLPMHAYGLIPDAELGQETFADQNDYWIEIMGRLQPGVSRAQAQSRMAGVFHRWVESTAANDTERAQLPSLIVAEGARGFEFIRYHYARPLYLLMALVGLILAIACVNIANLLLARSTTRRREMAVRLSMGAGQGRVVRQLLTESLLLAFLGGAVGVGVAAWGIRFLSLLLTNAEEKVTVHAGLNWAVLGGAAALSLLTGVAFGLAPAIRSTRVELYSALKQARTTGDSCLAVRGWLRVSAGQLLMVGQIAITMLILVAAGLFLRTLNKLQSVEMGFNPANVLSFRLNARQVGHRDGEIAAFYEGLRKRIGGLPGVRGASLTQSPLIGRGTWFGGVGVADEKAKTTNIMMTGPEFFETMQIPILQGRSLDERDRPGSPIVAVVNKRFVKERLGGANPIGQYLIVYGRNDARREAEIVGVSADARWGNLKGDLEPVMYLPFSQEAWIPTNEMVYVMRTAGNPLSYINTVREIVRQADPRLPVADVMTQAAQIDHAMSQEIAFARLCTALAILALVMAWVGIYGNTAYHVARRTSEIGIRRALGAQRGTVIWMVLREAVVISGAALVICVPVAYMASTVVAAFLFGVAPGDPGALVAAAVVLTIACLAAALLPARKASRIDPLAALRYE